MAASAINPGTTASIVAQQTPVSAATVAEKGIANNFTAFLQLLTTQLKNQNPLDPLDTNQFTQQLVQFAQVKQQLKSNDQLSTLVSLQKTAQQTQALAFVGMKVAVEGKTAELKGNNAPWGFMVNKPATATVNIANSAGATVYTGTF